MFKRWWRKYKEERLRKKLKLQEERRINLTISKYNR